MDTRILIGTDGGLSSLDGSTVRPVESLDGRAVTALVRCGKRISAIVDGHGLWEAHDGDAWRERAAISGPAATCLAATPSGLILGTEEAHLARFVDGPVMPVDSFETVEGRDKWYTPWGDPADVRSIAIGADGAIYVNVHVGGVVRSRDDGQSWTPTVDIEADVHQVLAHPTSSEIVLVASAEGFGVSRDGGEHWDFSTSGLHAHYLRAVAVSDGTVLISASTGPRGRRSAIYRKTLDGRDRFERCRDDLPEWFDDNIDTACLAASGPLVVFGTDDGRVFGSPDSGARWELLASELPRVRCVTIV
jgi:photosystem II stability/assembly factor-like uncharacterized protein